MTRPHLHNRDTPRHWRLFELIRQEDRALSATTRMRDMKVRRLSPEELARLQQVSARSMQRDKPL